ncbi:ATP-dependent DNA helicase RecG [Thermomicrobiaceae bacterium CFH 74404]|uniref:ATP-dependent DNA helicase RecG n=1 Tax=Thermalbibacter longus TaxID=2951981 RepID=A0AA41WAA4_9BACT|nr:ATP-dependent DNA helicase RecG [Thermalbibacter longus]MCM8749044.1 ATP-dependent DNA helicase RecG [Thermalbibacter longus]
MTVRSSDVDRQDPALLLEKVFALEERKGFQDTAVTGGLAALLARNAGTWLTARPALAATLRRLSELLDDYAALAPAERARRIAAARQLLTAPARITPVQRHRDPGHAQHAIEARRRDGRQNSQPAKTLRAPAISSLDDPVTILPGVGTQRARQLEALGVYTVRDLLYLLPRRYEDYTQVQPIGRIAHLFYRTGSEEIRCTVIGEVTEVSERETASGRRLVHAEISDPTGTIPAIWFNPYVARQLRPGMRIALSGRLERQRAIVCFRNPEWEPADEDLLHTGRIVPVYPLTRNLYQKQLRQLTRAALDAGLHLVIDPLPEDTRKRYGLPSLPEAIGQLHFPESSQQAEIARRRLAFDEFLALQLGLVRRKAEWQAQPGNAIPIDRARIDTFLRSLPFALTNAQARALDEILEDMAQPRPMSRLLQGDVGSGKTVVAAAAALAASASGYQVAVLAPTEILAEQHAQSFRSLYAGFPADARPAVALLTSSTPERARQEIEQGLRDGSIQLLIGTHAILEDWVQFQRLGLAIIDEQHRFGVLQRATLRAKGDNPDVLVMTATPIPRSLALVLHGDLDVSIIDEMPPGRQTVQTYAVKSDMRQRVYQFIRKQVTEGYQAFIIYPLVEESEAIDARAATVEFERLQREVFPDLRLGLLHGRMRPAEKDAVMTAFRDRELDILVSTAVVEVGIDVPNATVMLIEGADRFGLAQLHQFRGRVGRGAAQSYCILISDSEGQEARDRLEALVHTFDGFRLAEIDLQMRGPGEFLGTRQSGMPDLRFASLADVVTLQQARREAERIIEIDPELRRPEHRLLREQVRRFWQSGAGDLS